MDKPKEVVVPISWPNPAPTLQYSNQFVVEFRDTVVAFTFGQVWPTMVNGTLQEQHDRAVRLAETGLEVQDVTRVLLSRPVARQLLRVLEEHLGQEDSK